MCKYMNKRGYQCGISPNKEICHIHLKQHLLDHKKVEIRNLNKTISKRNTEITNFIENNELLDQEIVYLQDENENLQNENELLKDQIEAMKEDFEKYAKIKHFELIRFKLGKMLYDISDTYEMKLFLRNKANTKILIEFFGNQIDYWKYYNNLRLERNQLCHIFD